MPLQASWVGGSVARPQRTGPGHLLQIGGLAGTDISGFTEAPWTWFLAPAGTANFFTFAIPTPVIKDDRRTKLSKVFVFYQTPRDVVIHRVDVYDGRNGIHNLGSLNLWGPHDGAVDVQNSWSLPASTPEVRFDISVVVGVRFNAEGTIHFASAGADFVT